MAVCVVIQGEKTRALRLGRYVNVQDHAMIHIGYGTGTQIGDVLFNNA